MKTIIVKSTGSFGKMSYLSKNYLNRKDGDFEVVCELDYKLDYVKGHIAIDGIIYIPGSFFFDLDRGEFIIEVLEYSRYKK